MPLADTDLFVIQDVTNKKFYKLQLLDLLSHIEAGPSINFRGSVDLSQTPAANGVDPSTADNGDVYLVQADVNPINAGWDMQNGDTIAYANDRIVYSSATSQWILISIGINPDDYVNRSGDNMLGNLTFATDKINLGIDGHATFGSSRLIISADGTIDLQAVDSSADASVLIRAGSANLKGGAEAFKLNASGDTAFAGSVLSGDATADGSGDKTYSVIDPQGIGAFYRDQDSDNYGALKINVGSGGDTPGEYEPGGAFGTEYSIVQVDKDSTINWGIQANGSAQFTGRVDMLDSLYVGSKDNDAVAISDGAGLSYLKTKPWGSGTSAALLIAPANGQAPNYVFSDASLKIGGTLPDSPNIELIAGNGYATFAGNISAGGSVYSQAPNPSAYNFQAKDSDGNPYFAVRSTGANNGEVLIGGTLNPFNPNITLKRDGSATFAGALEAESIDGGTF